MSLRLREFVRNVRQCKTAAEERSVITKECALMRNLFKEQDSIFRHRNVAKLLFIHMLGYPTHFGQMECVKLIAHPGFPEKRIGYLALMLLIDERHEVLMLVTNSIKNDLSSSNQFVAGLALCSLGNVASTEMSRDLGPEVLKLLSNSSSYIRKKAALASIRILTRVPDLIEEFFDAVVYLLDDRHHGVLVATVQLITAICEDVEPEWIPKFRQTITRLVRILKNLNGGKSGPKNTDYSVNGVHDPFLQVKILKLLRLLGKGDSEASDNMSDILAQIASNTDGSKNAGNSILYECVLTIMGIESIGSLRTLAINILAKFLAKMDNNIRYVALSTLSQVVTIDTQAVQRHRNTIVDCVRDADASIRRRALELVYALVNENNIAVLTKELLEYLMVADLEFKIDLSNKICSLASKFAPEKRWYIDTILEVLVKAGSYIKDEVVYNLIIVISNAPDLNGYAVRKLFQVLRNGKEENKMMDRIAQVAVWCIGEYGEMILNHHGELDDEEPVTTTENEVVDLMEAVLASRDMSTLTKEYALVGLMKLSSRYAACVERIKATLTKYKSSAVLELQSRSCEFLQIFRHEKIRCQVLERMPALDEQRHQVAVEGVEVVAPTIDEVKDQVTNGVQPVQKPSAPANAPATSFLGDLLDMGEQNGSDSAPAMQSVQVDPLADLLGLGYSPEPVSSNSQTATSPYPDMFGPSHGESPQTEPSNNVESKQYPDIVAFNQDGISITFAFSKDPSSPQDTVITATTSNGSPTPVSNFNLQAAVPKFMQIKLEPANGTSLSPNGQNTIQQLLRVSNSMHGQKPLAMRLKIAYAIHGTPKVETVQVSDFPPGL